MDATAFNRCDPAAPDRQDSLSGLMPDNGTGKMAELSCKMQEARMRAQFQFSAIARDPQIRVTS